MTTTRRTVALQGPVLTQSGYGVHSRQIARWLLNRKDTDVKFVPTVWGDTPWIISPDAHDGLIGEIMKRVTNPDGVKDCDVSFQLQLPNEWNAKLSKKNVGVTAGVESDRCHPSWVDACNSMDAIVVPSQHSKSSITATGKVTKPFFVVPESFCDSIMANDVKPLNLELDTDFNFLIFGQITGMNPLSDRKNIFYTIKWLCEAFKDDPSVGIILKTNAGRNSRIDRAVVTNMMKQLMSEVRKGPGPKLHLLHGDMSDEEVAGLYVHPKVKCLVTLTRGEGYGLPILEAAASALPVIATNWSGHLDFLKHGKFIGIHYQLADVDKSRIDNRIFVQGSRWANASEQDFKKRALKFRESHEVPQGWAKDLSVKIKEKYSHSAICTAYESALVGII